MDVFAAWSDDIVKAASDELLKEARKNAHSDFKDKTGRLRAGIKKKKSRLHRDAYLVGAFEPHAHLVEFGTKLRVSPKTGKVSGHMPARPFLTAAERAVIGRIPEIISSLSFPPVEVKR
jgi:HK97 gp10 family phage protein